MSHWRKAAGIIARRGSDDADHGRGLHFRPARGCAAESCADSRVIRAGGSHSAPMHATRHLNKAAYGINTYSFTRTLRARECLAQLADLVSRLLHEKKIAVHFWPDPDGQ